MRRARWAALVLSCAGLSAACAPRAPRAVLAAPLAPPRFVDTADEGLLAAIDESLAWLRGRPDQEVQRFGEHSVCVASSRAALVSLREFVASRPSADALADYLANHFVAFESRGGDSGTVLFTGYYEPTLDAALQPSAEYPAPIRARPDDLVEVDSAAFAAKLDGVRISGRVAGGKLVPYATRKELDARRDLPVLAWARDPVDVFFAEVQGSATLRLPDGALRRIGYHASNGHKYRAIGAALIARGALSKESVSMQSVRAWLAANPKERDALLWYNESAVFFRWLDGAPLGALGRPVTPRRSIATDLRVFPKGALAYVQVPLPAGRGALSGLVLNQDTGGAIVGPGRVDVFFGNAPDAAAIAGELKSVGRLFFFMPLDAGRSELEQCAGDERPAQSTQR